MNQEIFPSFSMYPNLPILNNSYQDFTKNLLMKLSLQNFLINYLTLDSFNDLMAIHRKIDEMLQNLLFRQTNNNPFQMPNNDFMFGRNTFNVSPFTNSRHHTEEILVMDDNIRALTKEEINKIPMISFTKKIKKFKKTHHCSKLKLLSRKQKIEESISSSESEQNEPTAYRTCCICLSDYKIREKIRILNCKHRFHKKCIDSWLQEKNVCPLCKFTQ